MLMKRIFLLSCLSCLCAITLCAYDFEVNGIYYDILPDSNSVKVTSKVDKITNQRMDYKGDIVIPEIVDYRGKTYFVTEISRYAFDRCTELTSVSIPKGVREIGRYTFANCSNLQTISIIDTCCVEKGAFEGCDKLRYTVYDNAKYLGDKTNPYRILVSATDTKIFSCVIHEQTLVIAEDAFYRCAYLKDITLPNHAILMCSDVFEHIVLD